MVVKFNKNYLEPPKEIFWLLFAFKFIVNLTMTVKSKKVPEYFFWKLQIVFVELYNHYWPWNKSGEEVEYKIREKERKTRDAPRSKPQKKEESVFEEVGADTKNSERRA